jgi:hypothetical protein
MSRIFIFLKNKYIKYKNKYVEYKNKPLFKTETYTKIESNTDTKIIYEPLTLLEKQNECCVCMEQINEDKLSCGHNIHITCIILSKNINCPLCSTNILNDCTAHIIKCKNIKCQCKNKNNILEIEKIIVHDIMSNYMMNVKTNINKNNLEKLLKKNNIKNYVYFIDLYI